MNAGKLLFSQLMDFVPWTSLARSVARYGGDRRVRVLTCTEQYRAMAFAQLTYRESLRDIEACLNAQPNKLYAMGFRAPLRRSTLADANRIRDWRIYADLAQRLMAQARRLYASPLLSKTHFELKLVALRYRRFQNDFVEKSLKTATEGACHGTSRESVQSTSAAFSSSGIRWSGQDASGRARG